MKKVIITTDLDGTLLDASTYSFEAARDALRLIREQDIPLIICSSKTRAEIEYYRRLLNNQDPFIPENGGAIFIPEERQDLVRQANEGFIEESHKYFVIPLGKRYTEIRTGIDTLRSAGFSIRGFGDMDVDEIVGLTGLQPEEAAMAKERDFDEPFLFSGCESEFTNLLLTIKELGFNITRGRFYHLLGDNDKGRAVSILLDLYKRVFGDIYSVAVGDSLNDLPMLKKADVPVIVQKKNGTYDPALDIHSAIWAHGAGPEGWNRAITKIISDVAGQ
jgi:mannosyl-3-phosphoglycerate phosphatase